MEVKLDAKGVEAGDGNGDCVWMYWVCVHVCVCVSMCTCLYVCMLCVYMGMCIWCWWYKVVSSMMMSYLDAE